MHEITPEWFKTSNIKTSESDIVNGYALFECEQEIGYQTYLHLRDAWNSPVITSYDEFVEEFGKEACSEWNKMDEHGEYYAGFWESEDPAIHDKAGELTYERNAQMMWTLPFHKRFLIKTVDIGCANTKESVRYSNYLGVWFQRKREFDPSFSS